jgi:hypothetical protein
MKDSLARSILLIACLTGPILAQSRGVALGDRVRVLAPKAGYPSLTGTVVSTTPDVIGLTPDGSTTEIAVERSQIQKLSLSVATRRNTAKAAFAGALLFGGGAIWFGPKAPTREAPGIEVGRGSTKNVVIGAAVGASLGALIGHFVRSDTWIAISPGGP